MGSAKPGKSGYFYQAPTGAPMRRRSVPLMLMLLLSMLAAPLAQAVDLVRVVKSERQLYLLENGTVVGQYPVALGRQPRGHKQREGDLRTPEGRYILDKKNAESAFYRSIRISYPNDDDRARAAALGVPPGGGIMLHGQKNGFGEYAAYAQRFDWTEGCIALTDADMDALWARVAVGTPIEIVP